MSKKKIAVLVVAALLLIAALLPPMLTAGLFRDKIQASISNALGREVTVGETSLTLFPLGFQLTNVTIAEDPAFGAEPVIRADEVTASIRLASLWRGRMEIGKLSFKYPSVNLVRADDGRWNLSALIARTAQAPSAPTAQRHAESRPRFPYIETDTGRLNFKFGLEKKVFALVDADISLWQESENEWRARIEARPLRTDSNQYDTGLLRMNARFERAQQPTTTPLDVEVAWEGVQLGQLTTLIYGRDRGWRGAAKLQARLNGTPEALTVAADVRIDDFRRYDIYTTEKFQVAARCVARYASSADRFSDANCQVPTIGNGVVQVKGWLVGLLDPRAYSLDVSVNRVPAQTVVSFARHAKKNLPDDLNGSGAIEAVFSVTKEEDAPPVWQGGGATTGVVLTSRLMEHELALGNLRFAFAKTEAAPSVKTPRLRRRAAEATSDAKAETRLEFSPFAIDLGGTAPATGGAWLSATGYSISLAGDADVPRALQIGRVLGMAEPPRISEGKARAELAISGEWAGLPAPRATGMAQIRDLRTEIEGVTAPLQITEATLRLTPERAALEQMSASFTGVAMNFTGMISRSRACEPVEQCEIGFDLRADTLSPSLLHLLLNPNAQPRPWYRILTSARHPNPNLPKLRARGRIASRELSLGDTTLSDFSADVSLDSGVLTMAKATGELLGGKHSGQWQVDFNGQMPVTTASGEFSGMNAALLSRTRDGGGRIGGTYRFQATGWGSAAILASAAGEVNFLWRNGELRNLSLDSRTPLKFSSFAGTAELRNGTFTFRSSKMQLRGGILDVSGTASLSRTLDLRLIDGTRTVNVRGSLAAPQVEPAAMTVSQSTP